MREKTKQRKTKKGKEEESGKRLFLSFSFPLFSTYKSFAWSHDDNRPSPPTEFFFLVLDSFLLLLFKESLCRVRITCLQNHVTLGRKEQKKSRKKKEESRRRQGGERGQGFDREVPLGEAAWA